MPAPTRTGSTDHYVYRWLRPVTVCHPAFTPNHVTVIGFLLGMLGVGLMLRQSPPWWCIILLFTLRALADCLDGAIARRCGTTTAVGKTLDAVSDHIFFLVLSGVVLYKLKMHTRWDLSVFVTALLIITVMATYLANTWIALHRKSTATAPTTTTTPPHHPPSALAAQVSRAPWILRALHDHSVLVSVSASIALASFFTWSRK